MPAVVGRERELERIEGFLADARTHPGAFWLEGEAGIGKTAVWQEALRRGQEQGFLTLSCRPAEAEAKMAYAGLSDLFSPLPADTFADLPEPQRDALAVALLQTAPRARSAQPRAVAAAVLSALRRLVATTPVLIAVDDVQWLDRATATAISYGLRRLGPGQPVGLLVTTRGRSTPVDPSLSSIERTVVRLGPLGLSALYHVIRNELGLVFPRPTLQRIKQASAGNPLLAIELSRALDEAGGRPGPGEPLPVPDQLLALLQARVAKMSPSARECLLATALLSEPTVGDVSRALSGKAEVGLEEALDASAVTVRGDAIRFHHPLLGAATLSMTLPAKRREMHQRLADVVEDTEMRARHLALGAVGPDAGVATELEDAAARADRRGAPDDAAELLELSLQLTPTDDADARARRTVERARAVVRAGESREGARLLDELCEGLAPGPRRATALELRARIHWDAGTVKEGVAACEEALEQADGHDDLRARVLVTMARLTLDAERKVERARAAITVLEGTENADPALMCEALIALAEGHYCLGHGIPHDVVERGLALERTSPPANVADRMSAAYGTWLKYNGDLEPARTWLEATYRTALEEGDEGSLPYALSHLPQLELWTGNWARCAELASEHLELAERTGQARQRLTAIFNLSLVEAHQGHAGEARARIEEALPEAEVENDPWDVYLLLSALGFLELALGNTAEAVAALGRSFAIYEDTGDGDTPAVFENYAEALVLAGDLETAAQVVDLYERRARVASKAIALAPALRCRGLLVAARGNLDAALVTLDAAATFHDRVDMPFSRARTLLALGQVRKRRGARRAAKLALDEALVIFEGLGAPLWADRAAQELARIPLRRRTTGDDLTPSEERVAGLVATGLTNQEIARSLFMSVKTVESNLTRIYRKLGVRSRSELTARLAGADSKNSSAIP